MKIDTSILPDQADTAQAIRLRHNAYCLPVAGRPPLTLCPHLVSEDPGADGGQSHDSADVDPYTYGGRIVLDAQTGWGCTTRNRHVREVPAWTATA
jgi:hypothetical protein